MPTYHLRRFMRPTGAGAGITDDVETFDAAGETEAVAIAQSHAAEPDDDLLAVELRDEAEHLVWSLRRGETVSRRPDGCG